MYYIYILYTHSLTHSDDLQSYKSLGESFHGPCAGRWGLITSSVARAMVRKPCPASATDLWWPIQREENTGTYPLVMSKQLPIENGHLQLIYPFKMVIFHSYVSLPEGNGGLMRFEWNIPELNGGAQQGKSTINAIYGRFSSKRCLITKRQVN